MEEIWHSLTARFAVEHTRIEAFPGQTESRAKVQALMQPVKVALEGILPGNHALSVRADDVVRLRAPYEEVQKLIATATMKAAPGMSDGERLFLPAQDLPFKVALERRHGRGSSISLIAIHIGDEEQMRIRRVETALDQKIPKLAEAAALCVGTSVLVLESDDWQNSNALLVTKAVTAAASMRHSLPDIIVYVESDGSPLIGHIIKENDSIGAIVNHQLYSEEIP